MVQLFAEQEEELSRKITPSLALPGLSVTLQEKENGTTSF
jgi:hypothetical protein